MNAVVDDESMAALFKARAEESKIKRAMNRQTSARLLDDHGIEYVSKNNGAHLIVAGDWSFWPGTGLWKHQHLPQTGRGVRGLIRAIQGEST